MKYNHIGIVGVGLIGGSFALAARRAGLAKRITGWDRDDVLAKALKSGAIDAIEDSFASGRPSEADLVYLAAPVGQIAEFVRNNGRLLKPGSIVTDAGSSKREICRVAIEHLPGEVHFVGGHPMAGSHNSGFEFATPDLFIDAPYAIVPLTPPAPIDQAQVFRVPAPFGRIPSGGVLVSEAANAVADVARALGSKPIFLTAEEHDAAVALASHIPQLLATALAITAAESETQKHLVELAGPGFSDIIRLAASRWSVWEDICRTNHDQIETALDMLGRTIERMRKALKDSDFTSLGREFDTANDFTERFQTTRGVLKN
jgi:prephenate dehydrogenase